jgi:hypothetical protein
MQRLRLISKVGKNKWKVQHSDGAVTFHKTKKAAQAYKHVFTIFDPFVDVYYDSGDNDEG